MVDAHFHGDFSNKCRGYKPMDKTPMIFPVFSKTNTNVFIGAVHPIENSEFWIAGPISVLENQRYVVLGNAELIRNFLMRKPRLAKSFNFLDIQMRKFFSSYQVSNSSMGTSLIPTFKTLYGAPFFCHFFNPLLGK